MPCILIDIKNGCTNRCEQLSIKYHQKDNNPNAFISIDFGFNDF